MTHCNVEDAREREKLESGEEFGIGGCKDDAAQRILKIGWRRVSGRGEANRKEQPPILEVPAFPVMCSRCLGTCKTINVQIRLCAPRKKSDVALYSHTFCRPIYFESTHHVTTLRVVDTGALKPSPTRS